MRLQLKTRVLDLSQPVVMGVLNVTPDSFSDGGRRGTLETALLHAQRMVGEGAAIVDVGGESTRPGAEPVSEQEELDRVVPVVERLRRELDTIVSVDTMKPAVMRAACAAGAEIINDVMALQVPGALEAAKQTGAAVCLMHMHGEPRTMQRQPRYADVVGEVRDFLSRRIEACVQAGIGRERIVVDPGLGFGKTLEHNLELLANLGRLRVPDCPLLIGVSRKSMFQQLLGLAVEKRLHASLSAAALAVWQGVVIVRAHDVRETVEALGVATALLLRRKD